jgi:alkanesulfonate monooxygenase SsuD/methylene tetrahydromethanopterin reductase-like flavin-dependent oxidoreductase (luciferase family)
MGLDPLMQKSFFELMQEENKRGATILMSSHILNEVQRVCGRVAIIKEGRIITVDRIASMKETSYKRFKIEVQEALPESAFQMEGISDLEIDGKFYSLKGAHSGPAPAHPMGLWIGAYGPKMLNLTGRLGDGWVPSSSYAAPGQLLEMQKRIDEAALGAGRSPAAILRIYNVMGQIGEGASNEVFKGSVEQWVDELTQLALDTGMDTFILGLPEPPANQLERFKAEIAPRVLENVAANRQQFSNTLT